MKAIFEKIKKYTKFVKKIGSDADTDFKFIIIFTLILVFLFLIFGVFKLKKPSILGDEIKGNVATTTEFIDEKELDNVINSIRSKKENFLKIEKEGVKIIDPFW